MKVQVRLGLFETNSSSCHSLTICSEEEYDRWREGDAVYSDYEEKFVLIDELTDEEKLTIDEYDLYTYDGFFEKMSIDYEMFSQRKILPSGECVHVFGYYGYN